MNDNNESKIKNTAVPNNLGSYHIRANSFSSPSVYLNQNTGNNTHSQYQFINNSASHTPGAPSASLSYYNNYANNYELNNASGMSGNLFDANNIPNYRENKKFNKIFNTQVKLNLSGKPPYSYCTLLSYAILNSKNQRLTLNEIYSWFMKNYSFFKPSESGWKNSVRHNLSLNKCFIKISRPINEPGKGSYWTINKNYVMSNNYVNTNTSSMQVSQSPVSFGNSLNENNSSINFPVSNNIYGYQQSHLNPYITQYYNIPRRHSEPLKNNGNNNFTQLSSQNVSNIDSNLNTVYECEDQEDPQLPYPSGIYHQDFGYGKNESSNNANTTTELYTSNTSNTENTKHNNYSTFI